MSQPVLVVGVGAEGPASLPSAIQDRIFRADLLCGSERLLAHWAGLSVEKLVIRAGRLTEIVERLCHRGNASVVVLASGDPGFYGIAGTLLRHLPAGEIEIVPHVTSLQLAFAKAGLAWNGAVLVSAHARPLAEIAGWARRVPRLGLLTDGEHTPARIAEMLLTAGLDDCRAIVAENLGLPDERLIDTRLSDLPGKEFAPLNVLLVVHDPGWQPQPIFAPRPDDAYAHRRGLITKGDVRALILSRLALAETAVAWDIGAGSGAVSVEMALLAWRGQVFAVEQDTENLGYLRENRARFGAWNVHVVEGRAPTALEGLPQPDRVFIGGTGGQLAAILQHLAGVARSGCRVVMSLVTLENLDEALSGMRALGWSPNVTQANLAYGKDIAGRTRLAPLNPLFILSGRVP